jgi:hypothetical protein
MLNVERQQKSLLCLLDVMLRNYKWVNAGMPEKVIPALAFFTVKPYLFTRTRTCCTGLKTEDNFKNIK